MWQIQTLADARSFERFTRSFSSSVTKSLTSSTAVFIASMMNIQLKNSTMMMYSNAIKWKIMPTAAPTMISIGASLRIVLDSLNIIFRPLFESEMFWKIWRNTFFLSGFLYGKVLTPVRKNLGSQKPPL